MDECPLQTCVAGSVGHYNNRLVFASLCVIPECSAHDVAAPDFPAAVQRASRAAAKSDPTLAKYYADAVQRMHQVNKYLDTGWTCGEFVVPWRPWPLGVPFLILVAFFLASVLYASQLSSRKTSTSCPTSRQEETQKSCEKKALLKYSSTTFDQDEDDEEKKSETTSSPTITPSTSASTLSLCWRSLSPSSSSSSFPTSENNTASSTSSSPWNFIDSSSSSPPTTFWSAFDARSHLRKLVQPPPPETAILDGLRVGSMLWIMLGHVMAIISSSGAGYANPQAFLPPHGLTNTVLGQLLFSSRLAVDTFLVISGFLTVHVLVQKLPQCQPDCPTSVASPSPLRRYLVNLPQLLLARVVRIMPLYAMCLLFYTQVAPQLGGGPFWYQWLALLKPCHDYGWTNLLFINNFWPLDQPITNTCFYHSWYLAVDMQLFLAGSFLVFWYQARRSSATAGTALLWLGSVVITAILAAIRRWSVNTFDGAAVARYDMEAYANPCIRAVAYLTGMYLAMILPREKLRQRSPWRPFHHAIIILTVGIMVFITFATALGAYARRPCRYQDWPQKDECGSTWSFTTTWIYTSASRAVWCLCVGILIYLCLGRPAQGNPVASILSWQCWTPLSHLTFGAYLIHPVVIFIWQMGDRSKETFRLESFGMDYISVGVVSYVAALVAALTVEFPCAALWKQWTATRSRVNTANKHQTSSTRRSDSPEDQQQLQVVYGSVS